jgi:hypothetical protein
VPDVPDVPNLRQYLRELQYLLSEKKTELPPIEAIQTDMPFWRQYLRELEDRIFDATVSNHKFTGTMKECNKVRHNGPVATIKGLFDRHVTPTSKRTKFNPTKVHAELLVEQNSALHYEYMHDGVCIEYYSRAHGDYDLIVRKLVMIDGKVILRQGYTS